MRSIGSTTGIVNQEDDLLILTNLNKFFVNDGKTAGITFEEGQEILDSL